MFAMACIDMQRELVVEKEKQVQKAIDDAARGKTQNEFRHDFKGAFLMDVNVEVDLESEDKDENTTQDNQESHFDITSASITDGEGNFYRQRRGRRMKAWSDSHIVNESDELPKDQTGEQSQISVTSSMKRCVLQ